MNKWSDLAKKTLYLAAGAASQIAEETEKGLNKLGDKTQELLGDTQEFLEEMIERGEAEVSGANMPPKASQKVSHLRQPSAKLKRQLSALVLGDMELADRLLASAREKYPNQSEDWYWEKVIRDLERDRCNH
ncbi:MAG: hypothetical protein F6J93_26920 [Oscillatoria sp. SIO1A7]|nr:hypothetical protein [Oscillatoria sp. SIO1A7]